MSCTRLLTVLMVCCQYNAIMPWKIADMVRIVLIHVLDARDPLGTRCRNVEKYIREEAPHKHLIFVLNKCDLVPTSVAVCCPSFLCSLFQPLSHSTLFTQCFEVRISTAMNVAHGRNPLRHWENEFSNSMLLVFGPRVGRVPSWDSAMRLALFHHELKSYLCLFGWLVVVFLVLIHTFSHFPIC